MAGAATQVPARHAPASPAPAGRHPRCTGRRIDSNAKDGNFMTKVDAGAQARSSSGIAGMDMPCSEGVARTYDRYAPVYDRLFGHVFEPGRALMAQVACAHAPRRLLEVGVGTGLTLARYPRDTQVTGIDVSADMLQRARRRAAAELRGRDLRLEQVDAEHMPYADASFDCVTLPYVLSVTPNPARLVREVRRVCRPDGVIVVLNHFNGSGFWWLLERAARPLAARVGFRPDFCYREHVLAHDWQVLSVRSANLFGLSKVVELRNAPPR
jgi:phosphatidylethanolamine/phosphatidyl-N-methylethanolamine N-methyltransferase